MEENLVNNMQILKLRKLKVFLWSFHYHCVRDSIVDQKWRNITHFISVKLKKNFYFYNFNYNSIQYSIKQSKFKINITFHNRGTYEKENYWMKKKDNITYKGVWWCFIVSFQTNIIKNIIAKMRQDNFDDTFLNECYA